MAGRPAGRGPGKKRRNRSIAGNARTDFFRRAREAADKVTAASGRDIVARKASAAAEKLRADGLQNRLSEANGKLSGC